MQFRINKIIAIQMSAGFLGVLILDVFLDPCLKKKELPYTFKERSLMLTCQFLLLFKPKFFLIAVCVSMT